MAGNLKPNVSSLGKEVSAVVNAGYGFDEKQVGVGLLDGISAVFDQFTQNSAMYWRRKESYLDISMSRNCNIWRYGMSAVYIAPFRIYRYQNDAWLDITSTIVQVVTAEGVGAWEKTIYDLPKGRYKFTVENVKVISGNPYRMDAEWYLENTAGYYLYVKEKQCYGQKNGLFSKFTDDWTAFTPTEQKALFVSTDYETASAEDLATLGKFKILTYSETEGKPEISLTATPKDQLILPKGLIITGSFEGIDKATLTNTTSGNGTCKLLITNDLTTYQTYDFTAQEWQIVDHTDLAAVKEKGITVSQLPNIDRAAWDKITTGKQGIGFAYLLGIESTSDVCSVDNLNLTVDMKGSWDKAIHGTDYTYGYPANNVLKVMLKSNGDYKINYSEGAK